MSFVQADEPAVPQPEEDVEVPSFWRALGLPGLADVHVHFMPSWLMQRVWAHFDKAGPLVGREWPVRYRWSDDERVAYLRQLGVRQFSALSYAHRPGLATELNEWALEFARKTPGCLRSATFYPEEGVADYVTEALDSGAQVFKVHLQVGRYGTDNPLLDPVWGLLSEAGVPIVMHAGHVPIGNEHTGPDPFAALLARFPRLPVIVAHMGMPDYEPFLRMAEEYERVALDTTMAFTTFFEGIIPFPRELMPRLHALGLAGKVLLGSDFPNFPWAYADQVAGLARLDLDEDWLRAVCWHNSVALFGSPLDSVATAADR
ncbi:amidohydrolase [Lentzea sp. NBRC 105346]|uniref:amidohydrolase family protein n=1 Tax=Lentzea sp. NBRC 105346 TaxID=3032205 RepID=UPI0024A251EF|nr:amidohydrolase family protein [Lentzea sp. NBRC 105346]GLZ29238.1 amidohydrolase [Lentzea sp. NBRC 105346]